MVVVAVLLTLEEEPGEARARARATISWAGGTDAGENDARERTRSRVERRGQKGGGWASRVKCVVSDDDDDDDGERAGDARCADMEDAKPPEHQNKAPQLVGPGGC